MIAALVILALFIGYWAGKISAIWQFQKTTKKLTPADRNMLEGLLDKAQAH